MIAGAISILIVAAIIGSPLFFAVWTFGMVASAGTQFEVDHGVGIGALIGQIFAWFLFLFFVAGALKGVLAQ